LHKKIEVSIFFNNPLILAPFGNLQFLALQFLALGLE